MVCVSSNLSSQITIETVTLAEREPVTTAPLPASTEAARRAQRTMDPACVAAPEESIAKRDIVRPDITRT